MNEIKSRKEVAFDIRNMTEGDKLMFDVWTVWRIPGGWLYAVDTGTNGVASQFVPLAFPLASPL